MESNLENHYPNIDQNFEDEQFAEDSKEKESVNLKYYENKLEIVTRVAFLCGVADYHFTGEKRFFMQNVYETLKKDGKALLIRNLCLLRNSIEHNFKKISNAMTREGRAFFGLKEYYPQAALSFIEDQGIRLPTSSRMLSDILGEINKTISDRINNCKDIFPTWVNWEYLRELRQPQGIQPS